MTRVGSQNIHRISSLVAKANVVICARPGDDAMQLNRTSADAIDASDAASNDPQQLPILAAHPQ
jgi:hypothetical protein